MLGLARSAAVELASEKIRVNCLSPGLVQSEMAQSALNTLTPEQLQQIVSLHPLGLGTTEDVAHAAAYLLADTGRWITGTNLIVDGGYCA